MTEPFSNRPRGRPNDSRKKLAEAISFYMYLLSVVIALVIVLVFYFICFKINREILKFKVSRAYCS